ncbi:cell division protein ZipA [Photobacterium aphoticum]|uniref:Cell division protein ZipA n=2 Tax=Photobacterium aphoticum TaxID=754436 RepID=A0A0J1GS35_9GAMM|nr:cell division protein ZipA [Photobacterium aphoticum]KLV02575.1 hypothetical protein ABT58_02740 [Photobacterium aphoticum]GHA47191.1 hypothetical protein GCM10007086_21240 [Photobacterium aphoticum]
MQELRLVLIVVGTLAIAALLLHGLWSSRKEKPAKFGEKPIGKLEDPSRDSDGFDQDGVGSVRVVNQEVPAEPVRTERKEPALHFGAKPDADPLLDSVPAETQSPVAAQSVPQAATSQDSVQRAMAHTATPVAPVAQPMPAAAEAPRPDAQPAVAQAPAGEAEPVVAEAADQPVTAPAMDSAVNATVSEPVVAERVEPTLTTMADAPVIEPTLTIEDIERGQQQTALDDMIVVEPSEQPLTMETSRTVMSAAEPQVAAAQTVEPQMVEPAVEPVQTSHVVPEAVVVPEPEPEPEPEVLPPDFLVLNVHARHGDLLRGPALFAAFEQNNLIFGENAVYHRHSDMAGTGPTLFSVTNMVAPGHFSVEGNQHFETPGVAFYLMLPCEAGRADQSFNSMLQTVQRIADVLGADVLDHERNLITPHRISEYREKAMRYTRA